jgi:nitrogen regulatory protein PII-like uncharacterized protein
VTSEQIQQLIDRRVNQHDLLWLVAILFAGIVGFFIAHFGAYARQKGQNLATKEDISTLTHTVESIKTDFAAKQHFSRVRYEMETKIYGQIWEKLIAFDESVQLLVVKKDQERESPELERSNGARNGLIDVIKNNQPFYPREIWQELITCQQLCHGLKILKPRNF